MGKPFTLATLIVSALCFSSLQLGLTHGDNDPYYIQGRIYCDPCRLQLETRSSRPLKGVTVNLECTASEKGSVAYSKKGLTDQYGVYTIEIDSNHKNEYCEITTDQSTHIDCADIMAIKGDKTVAPKNNVSPTNTRSAKPLGFMTKQIDHQCAQMIKENDLFIIGSDD